MVIKKKTPEEELKQKQQQNAGNAAIREREKLASAAGVSSKAAARELSAREEGKPTTLPGGQVSVEEVQANKQEAIGRLQGAGAFEQVTPGEVSLQPSPKFGENIPVVGPSTAAIGSILENAANKGWLGPLIKTGEGAETSEEAFPTPQTPETLREEAIRKVSQKSYEKGISAGESFGAFVESIPIVGGLVSKYARGLVETPSGNADNVIGEIRSERERAATSAEKVRNGLITPSDGFEIAQQMEINVAELEGRLKLLINTSAILRANTDEINKIQQEILRTKERVNQLRLAAGFAMTAQMSGTGRIIPTDEQLFYELKELAK